MEDLLINMSEETRFVADEVNTVIKAIKDGIESVVGDITFYQHSKVHQWSSSIMENCFEQLVKLKKPYKYIVTCVIVQKNTTGVSGVQSSSCFWDNTTDGSCTVRWENKTMYCIVSVFGTTIKVSY